MNPFSFVHKTHFGYCPICEKWTIFSARTNWLRDEYTCFRCKSIPRHRAFAEVLNTHFPEWREMRIHESSPSGASSAKLARECAQYTGTYFFADVQPGSIKDGYRCENLEAQTFDDGAFDLVVTQDVFEHVLHPDKAFQEIARTLKPGGSHLFTVPWYYWQPTRSRVVERDGKVENVLPAEYHGNPIDEQGALVITEWGFDLPDFISRTSGLMTIPIRLHDPSRGIEAKFIEVFISHKRGAGSQEI